jgi:hypothetical protein
MPGAAKTPIGDRLCFSWMDPLFVAAGTPIPGAPPAGVKNPLQLQDTDLLAIVDGYWESAQS